MRRSRTRNALAPPDTIKPRRRGFNRLQKGFLQAFRPARIAPQTKEITGIGIDARLLLFGFVQLGDKVSMRALLSMSEQYD